MDDDQQPEQPEPVPAPPPWGPPAPPDEPDMGWMSTQTKVLIAIGAVGVVAVAAVLLFVVSGGGHPKFHTAATLAGEPLMTSEVAKGLAEGMRNEIKSRGAPAPVVALYGPASQPKYILMEFGISLEAEYGNLPNALTDVGTGVASTAGSLDVVHAVYDTRGGTDLGCAPLSSGETFLGSMCMWDDGDTTGFVVLITVSELQSALDITSQAHDASVG
jgi:hypothetical protein